jgi:hypothetical protein
VDFNSSEETTEVREKAAQEVEMVPPDPVGEAMEVDRMKTWVAEEYLNQASGRRISVEDGLDVSLQTAEQLSLQLMVPFRALTELLLGRFRFGDLIQIYDQLVDIDTMNHGALFDIFETSGRAA